MKLYSDFGGRRVYQVLGDLAAVAVVVVGIVVAVAIGSRLSGVPLIGGGISAPFATASDAGGTLADAGTNWQNGVEHLATLVGWTVAALVVLVVLVGWVRPRVVGAIRRAAIAKLASASPSLDLLALRALATRPAKAVTRLDEDVVAAWRRGDPEVIRRLAALELKASGVRLSES